MRCQERHLADTVRSDRGSFLAVPRDAIGCARRLRSGQALLQIFVFQMERQPNNDLTSPSRLCGNAAAFRNRSPLGQPASSNVASKFPSGLPDKLRPNQEALSSRTFRTLSDSPWPESIKIPRVELFVHRLCITVRVAPNLTGPVLSSTTNMQCNPSETM